MKLKVLALLAALIALSTPATAQDIPDNALRGQARNITVSAEGPSAPSVGASNCFPLTGATTSFDFFVECAGGKGSLGTSPVTASYTTITMTISSPVLPGELLEIAAIGDGLSLRPWCAIQPGKRFCSQTSPPFTASFGGPVGVVIRRFNTNGQAFPLTEVSWAVY